MASFVGQRVLNDLNRLKITVVLEADGNPKIIPGSTLDVNSKISSGKYLVDSVQTTMTADGGYKINASASSFFGDAAFEEPPLDIFAAFTALQVISIGDPKYMVEFDGSSSYSSVAPIVNYTWTMPDASVHNEGSNPTIWWTFDQADITNGNSQTVTLTVTDGLNHTAFVTSGITLEWLQTQASVKYRHLYAAFNTKAVCSTDGGQNWIAQPLEGTVLSVAASNFAISGAFSPSGYGIFGTGAGNIYKTIDALAHIYQVHAAGSAVLDLNVPELDARFAVAGTEDGKVYRSVDNAETWSQIGTFAFPIIQVKTDYTNFEHITIVGSGLDHMYETTDAGGSWGHITTGVTGLWAADSNINNYLAHTTGIKNLSTSTELTGGTGPFVALTYGVGIDDSVTPGAGIMSVNSVGQHYNYSGGLVATQNNATNLTKHMIRDGEVPFLVYYATASGIGKSLDSNVTMSGLYYPPAAPDGGWGYKVAYGPLAAPISPARLLWRGSMVPATTWAWAGLGTSGWVQIPNVGSEWADPIRAVSAGYAIYGLNTISYISVPTEGIPVSHPDVFTYPEVVEGFGYFGISLHISRKIAASGSIPRVFALARQSNTQNLADVFVWNNLFANPSTYTTIAAPIGDPGEHRQAHTYPSYAIPKNKDVITFSVQQNVFSNYFRWYRYDIDKGSIVRGDDNKDEPPPNQSQPYKYVALSTDWWTIAQHAFVGEVTTEVTSDFLQLQNPSFTYTQLTDISPESNAIIYDSVLDPASIYVGLPAGVSAPLGVHKINMYGTGTRTELLVISGFTLEAFSVTHDIAETKDYLAAAFKSGDGTYALSRYSIDGGLTWLNGPDILYGGAGHTQDIFYIDTR